jgi:hypothetical protein
MSSPTSQTAADSGGAAFPPNYLHDLSTTLNIYRTIGGLEEKVHVLEITAKSNSKNIDTLTEKAYAIPYLEREFAQTKKDLNDLGERHNKEVHDLAMKLEKGLNDLGRRLGQDITNLKDGDIAGLKSIASVAKGLGALVLAVIAGGGLVYLLTHFPGHWSQ